METFFTFLEKRVADSSSLLCIGLDPHPADLTVPTAEAALKFCSRIVRQTAPVAAAFKPNAAFFEVYGPAGWQALADLIGVIQAESQRLGSRIPVILDAKRGDIASTAAAYARSAFENLDVDAITLSPYLGRDSLEPFITVPEKGVFLLCKTSNQGSQDLQDLPVRSAQGAERLLYEQVAALAQSWNTANNLGLVVGATHPDALARVRAAAPQLWFLSPGVGAQGGDLETAMRAGLRTDGLGMLVNVSRSIARASDPARAAAALRDEIAHLQYQFTKGRQQPAQTARQECEQTALMDGLLQAGCVRFGTFTLKSGQQSPIYIDLRRLVGYPELLEKAARAYRRILADLVFDRLAALPYAALPIGSAVSLAGNWPLIYPRKEIKAYGTKAEIEGVYEAGERVVVIDDLISTGGSKFEGIEKLASAGLRVEDVVVLIDRSPDQGAELAARGYRLHAVLTLVQMLDYYAQSGKVPSDLIQRAREFLKK